MSSSVAVAPTNDSSARPLFARAGVEFIGKISEREKDSFLGQALALLFPIRWPEPFGLVMAEALATGTPIVAGRFGSVPKLVEDGGTGLIGDSLEEMALAVRRLSELDRAACRRRIATRFSAHQMADGYERIYQAMMRAEGMPPMNRARVHEVGGVTGVDVTVAAHRNGRSPSPVAATGVEPPE